MHDHRKSYSRPVKQYQKRRISVDSGSESEHDEAESHKKTRKIKRKKLVEAPEVKLACFVKILHFFINLRIFLIAG